MCLQNKFKVLITEAGFEKIIGLLNNTFLFAKKLDDNETVSQYENC